MKPTSLTMESPRPAHEWFAGAIFIAVVVACWAWIVPMAIDMYGGMTGSSAWMMVGEWDVAHLSLLFAMWVVMMTGMMLPSAAPMLLRYTSAAHSYSNGRRAVAYAGAITVGYLVVWTLFSLLATVLQRGFAQLRWLNPMMEPGNHVFGAALLALAGVYQLTPWRRAFMDSCRSSARCSIANPDLRLSRSFQIGVFHGLKCLGCCWALMLLLFVGGVMNLWCIAALTIFVILEKLGPFGVHMGSLSGVALLALSIWYLFAQ